MEYTKEQKIEKGKEIKEKVDEIWYNCFDYENYSNKQCREFQRQVKELWDQCLGHHFIWHDTNPYSEDCRCEYCNADSPRTINF